MPPKESDAGSLLSNVIIVVFVVVLQCCSCLLCVVCCLALCGHDFRIISVTEFWHLFLVAANFQIATQDDANKLLPGVAMARVLVEGVVVCCYGF